MMKITTPLGKSRHVEPLSDHLTGRLLNGRYRILSRIGRGGMATVYLARALESDILCAVKVMHRSLMKIEKFRERFHIETEAVTRVRHPNVITIFEHGLSDEGLLYMVMEFIPGRSLRKAIEERSLPPGHACWIASEVASALDAAHRAGVIHRDLKPENVFLMREPLQKEHQGVKVLDFGIAKILDAPSITSMLHVLGTPEYLSPEQANQTEVDARSDLYSLGVMLYEMLTQTLPFSAESVDEILRKHRTMAPDPPSLRSPSAGITRDLDDLVLSCLAKNPDDRPETAVGLRNMLFKIASELGEGVIT